MGELKTLATCKPSEFLKQTYKIKKFAEKWITDTDILNIRKKLPVLEMVPKDASEELRKEIFDKNKQLVREQALKNYSEMFDSIAGEHPDETMELLALCCFVDADHIDDYKPTDYLAAFNSLISCKEVIDFFTSFLSLAQMDITKASKA